MGIIATVLSACGLGPRSDAAAVQGALQAALDGRPEHLGGTVQFRDSASAGTAISGVFTVQGDSEEDVAGSLGRILEVLATTYLDQPRVRTAFVRVECHPEGQERLRVHARDIVPGTSTVDPTTDDLAEHFDL